MKTLKESLFDADLGNKDVLLGDLYEFSDVAHYNSVSNSLILLINHFDRRKLAKAAKKCKIKPDNDNNFIEYYIQYDKQIVDLITVILNVPYRTITNETSWQRTSYQPNEKLKDYFSDLLKSTKVDFWTRAMGNIKDNTPEIISVEIITDIMSSNHNRLQLAFEDR